MKECIGIDEAMLLSKKERNYLLSWLSCIEECSLDDFVNIVLNAEELKKLKQKVNYFHK